MLNSYREVVFLLSAGWRKAGRGPHCRVAVSRLPFAVSRLSEARIARGQNCRLPIADSRLTSFHFIYRAKQIQLSRINLDTLKAFAQFLSFFKNAALANIEQLAFG